MSVKAKGLYITRDSYIMKWDDNRLWYIWPGDSSFKDVWVYKSTEGWEGEHELEGAALVAPLPILFWEKR